MARNSVAANLLMLILLVGGSVMATSIKQEVFPEFNMNFVSVSVPYPGASPEEVEEGICLAIEEAVNAVDGVKRLRTLSGEGGGTVIIELDDKTDENRAVADIKNVMDQITSFPQDAERPVINLLSNRREVISLIVYGDANKHSLRTIAEEVRDGLLQNPLITTVELGGTPPPEISVEVSASTLRAHQLTLSGIANEIRQSALDLPAGGIKTSQGELLLRTKERRRNGVDFESIPIASSLEGSVLRLGDIATIQDGYAETFEEAFFNGKPAVIIKVFRSGDQTPIAVANATKDFLAGYQHSLPEGIEVSQWLDWSEMYRDRIGLLVRNAKLGLILVLLILGMFLEIRLAFWVTMGIPISFLGSLFLMPSLGVSINMISLFAFIVTLGMVVDDAIVVGENIFEKRKEGLPYLKAAIQGAREVAVPVTFSILTTIAAFMPMFFVPGISGKLFRVIPAIVVSVLLISLIESIFILPAHLAHQKERKTNKFLRPLMALQKKTSGSMVWFANSVYQPIVKKTLEYRYATIACLLAMLMATIGYVGGGHIDFTFMPRVDSDFITVSAELPYGAPIERTREVQAKLVADAKEVIDEMGGEKISRGIFTLIGRPMVGGGPVNISKSVGGSHTVGVRVFLVESAKRNFPGSQFRDLWRARVGNVPGLVSIKFASAIGPSTGAPIDVQLSHPDNAILEKAASELAVGLESFAGVQDIENGVELGKAQSSFRLRPQAKNLGLNTLLVGRQIRDAYLGAPAIRQQRGREELRVWVRLPETDRQSRFSLENMLIRTPMGTDVPLEDVAEVEQGRAYTIIRRDNGRRVIDVTADIVDEITNAEKVLRTAEIELLTPLVAKYPGLRYSLEGEHRHHNESMNALKRGFMLALLVIFGLLAIPFKSYIQPIVVMSAIPFGFIGAVIGHVIMGFNLSMISMMGIVALAGVVVNDSLVLVHTANVYRDAGASPMDAIRRAGVRRFRPIMLTSLTTFFGLVPMIMETSVQARFLIPMAISLGFGVLFATLVILVLVPASYLVAEDAKTFMAFLLKDPPSDDEISEQKGGEIEAQVESGL
jgi:multidrug efflux pump subunit AcrB